MNETTGTIPKSLHLNVFYPQGRRPTVEELQNPDNWDLAGAATQPPIRNRRSVVSVAFPSGQFQSVAREARRQGKKISAFIREAAMRAVEP